MRSRSLRLTCLRLTAATLAAALVPGIAVAAAQAAPDYSGYTAARFIPFENVARNLPPWSSPPTLRFSIQGKLFIAAMDTGSTGVVLSASSIPGYTPKTTCNDPSSYTGWEYLSSSQRLWVGHWIPQEINFLDARGANLATAKVPVLAVECEVICQHYDVKAAQPVCPGQPLLPANPGIRYMGVGFGREHDGQSQATPDKNPLINIVQINGAPIKPGTMRSGYVITTLGVHVGLTAANTSGFAYTGLTLRQPPSDKRDWQQARICVAVDGSACAPGSGLVDTGIKQMYLSVPSSVPVKVRPNTNVLANGSRVTVRFLGDPEAIAFYSFVVGQMDPVQPMQPYQVILAHDAQTFVNTGRHFLRDFNVLFDADGGYFGLRWTGPANSPQGGLGPGPQTSP